MCWGSCTDVARDVSKDGFVLLVSSMGGVDVWRVCTKIPVIILDISRALILR